MCYSAPHAARSFRVDAFSIVNHLERRQLLLSLDWAGEVEPIGEFGERR